MKILRLQLCILAAAGIAWAQTPCEKLAGLSLPNTKITLAQTVAAGEWTPPLAAPGGRGGPGNAGRGAGAGSGGRGSGRGVPPAQQALIKSMPAFCRISVTLTPTSDSDIKSEIWLPVSSSWNGKFEVMGNGGWAGTIPYPTQALVDGYAAGATDTGHVASDQLFGIGHPEKIVDFGWRAVHETAVAGKALIAAFYGSPTKESYFNGCSTGGRQAMAAAEKYPTDFNGIAAGAGVNPNTLHHMNSMIITTLAHKDNYADYIPPSKYPMIHKAVLDKCDALDGVKDGLIENPLVCKFDPAEIQCKGEDGPSCLTNGQVELARQFYSGSKNSRTGELIYPGYARGTELTWGVEAGPNPEAAAIETFRNVVFQDPNWDWRTLNMDSDMTLAVKEGKLLVDIGYDLSAFVRAGGKMLIYHGWNDGNVAAQNSINYYNNVMKAMGGESRITNSIRLFMVPGMGHCQGGEGAPSTFDKAAVVDAWVTTGKAPDKIIGSHLTDDKLDRTRPLCPYPQIAKYKGAGSTDDAANFSCAKP